MNPLLSTSLADDRRRELTRRATAQRRFRDAEAARRTAMHEPAGSARRFTWRAWPVTDH